MLLEGWVDSGEIYESSDDVERSYNMVIIRDESLNLFEARLCLGLFDGG